MDDRSTESGFFKNIKRLLRSDHSSHLSSSNSLQAEETLLQSVFESIQDGISVLDTDLTVLRVNATMKRWYAESLPLEGKKCYQCYHHTETPCNPCPTLRCIQSGRLETDIVPGPSGSPVKWIELYSYPMRDRTGKVVGVVEFVRDITVRREAELKLRKANEVLAAREKELMALNQQLSAALQQLSAQEESLRESEERYRAFYQEVRDGCCAIDLQGRFTECNPAFERLTGYSLDELKQMSYEDLTPPKWHDMERKILREQVSVQGFSALYEKEYRHRDGHIFPIELQAYIKRDRQGRHIGYWAFVRDVSERKKAEHQLERFAAAIQNAAETVMIMDSDGTIQYVNPAIEQLTGFTSAEVIGKNPFFTTLGIYTSDFYRNVWETLQSGTVWRGHMTNIDKSGRRYELDTVISPIREASGAVVGYVSIGRDITKEIELEQQLRHSQKMEAIGKLAGGIAHDFNNILSAIIGYAELSREQAPAQGPLRHNLSRILEAADRAKNLVLQILAFSRKTQPSFQPLNLTTLIQEAFKLLRPTLPSTIDIQTRISNQSAVIMGDPTQVQQVLINLCANAAHAMREHGGTLTIEAETVTLDEAQAAMYPEIKPGDYAMLVVRDTGTGISPEIIDRIFDPFFTTKEVGQGTGMGLAVVHGIVKNHGGAIRVESRPGEGSSFFVVFPLSRSEAPQEAEMSQDIPGGSESVLVVDDEEHLLIVCSRMLESLGYRVIPASTGAEALRLFLQNPGSFDLIVTDQTMPTMTGYELAKRVLEVRPGMPIVLCTGYSETVSEEKAHALGIKGFAFKPLNRAELARVVRTVLDTRP